MRRRMALAVGAVAAVAVIGGALTLWAATRPTGPDETARAYLTALASGDADAVAALVVTDDEDADPARTFAAASSYPEDPRIEDLDQSGDVARVRATAVFDRTEREIVFGMQRVAEGWRVTHDFLAAVDISTSLGDAVRVGDVLVPVGTVSLLPAVYEFSASPPGLVAGSVIATVSSDRPVGVRVEASLAPEATERLQEQIDAYARKCTTGGAEIPDACGLRIPWAADLATVSGFAYRLERVPALSIAPDARTFVASGGVVIATATGVDHAGREASFIYRNDAWTLRGDVRIEGDVLTLGVR